MSQSELADGFVTISMISQLERNRNTASVELLRHIARKLQIPLHELVEDDVGQMAMACQHKLVKVYLEIKEPNQAEPLLHQLRARNDLSQAESIELTVELGECWYQQKRYEETLGLLIPLSDELEAVNYDDARMLALIRYTIGNVYYGLQNYTHANYNYRKAYDYTSRFTLFDLLAAKISYNVGITLRKIGHSQESLFFLERTYKYFQGIGDMNKLAMTVYAQGISYKNLKDYAGAVDSFSTAMNIFFALNLMHQYHIIQHTMASTVTALEDPQRALSQLEKCAVAFKEQGSISDLVRVLTKKSAIQLDLENYEMAERELQQAEEFVITHNLHGTDEGAECFQACARYHLKLQDFKKCVDYALKSASVFDTIGLLVDQVDSLQIAAEAYEALADTGKAYDLQKRCVYLLRVLSDGKEGIL